MKKKLDPALYEKLSEPFPSEEKSKMVFDQQEIFTILKRFRV